MIVKALAATIVLKHLVAFVRRIASDEPAPPPPPPRRHLPTEAEIDAKLQAYAASRGMAIDLNSIVDMLRLADMRSDFTSRAALWVDLEHNETYTGSAEQNGLMLAEVRHQWIMGDL